MFHCLVSQAQNTHIWREEEKFTCSKAVNAKMQQFELNSKILKSLNQSLSQTSMEEAEYKAFPYITWPKTKGREMKN